ncbi:hypothetical protein G6F57_015150 [Rhizopus arrhizus]|nr:hypothetical protein G6F22_020734 [Rhizopus arrhizus]KAG1456201.1 hypothetical protein G6F57_015150 [Rhizopus arrhizus]
MAGDVRLQRPIRPLRRIEHIARSKLLPQVMQRLPAQLRRTLFSIAAQQDLLELDQVLQDAPVAVPRDPARISQVAAIARCEIKRILATPTPAHGATDEHQVALAWRQRQAIPIDQMQATIVPHQ